MLNSDMEKKYSNKKNEKIESIDEILKNLIEKFNLFLK